MKKAFLLLCTLLLVLGSLLPLAGYRLAKAVLGEAAASSEVPASSAHSVVVLLVLFLLVLSLLL